MVTQKPVWESDIASQPPTIRPVGINPAKPGIPRINPAFGSASPASKSGDEWRADEIPATAAADTDTRPVRPAHRVRPTKPAPTRPEGATIDKNREAPAIPRAAPATPAPLPIGADPYDAEAFNRQNAETAKAGAK